LPHLPVLFAPCFKRSPPKTSRVFFPFWETKIPGPLGGGPLYQKPPPPGPKPSLRATTPAGKLANYDPPGRFLIGGALCCKFIPNKWVPGCIFPAAKGRVWNRILTKTIQWGFCPPISPWLTERLGSHPNQLRKVPENPAPPQSPSRPVFPPPPNFRSLPSLRENKQNYGFLKTVGATQFKTWGEPIRRFFPPGSSLKPAALFPQPTRPSVLDVGKTWLFRPP